MTPYIPKGSMCIACIHRSRDCSHLRFHAMQPVEKQGNVIIVRCTDFSHEAKKGGAA